MFSCSCLQILQIHRELSLHRFILERSQRAGLPYVQEINDGSHQLLSGVRGRVHSTSGDKLQHSSQPGGSNSFSPTIVRKQGASQHHEDYQQARWHLISPDGTQGSARLHGSDKRSRHQHLREQQYIYRQKHLVTSSQLCLGA